MFWEPRSPGAAATSTCCGCATTPPSSSAPDPRPRPSSRRIPGSPGTARSLGLAGVRVVKASAAGYLAGAAGAPVDLVLIDPPYGMDSAALSEILAPLARERDPWLAEGAVVVVERATRSGEPDWPAGLRRFASKKYGETTVWFAEPSGEDSD